MNSVVWHAGSQARQSELMADAVVAGVSLTGLPRDWHARATEIARRALLAHRDGAAVVAGTYANEPATLDVAEAFVGALLEGGLSEREAAWTCWSVVYFILGLCQEEQAMPHRSSDDLTPGQRPALENVLPFLAEESFDERFEFGVAKLLAR
ncbi:TetR family transcriptional regulator [Lentzea atacamensis]|uniref:TetR family transcriptional regulator n=1 Tax=Lentzea atacamensis TaxID=531938 RepID=A0ABX9EFX5_9PSEU|nr:TetR/AcrR family transcriptional regulator C-terminal domain-containing protein [Lentzea atacamensis]RAS70086.1 TetR family transcriptional regulator [Lentzea atacamensis]